MGISSDWIAGYGDPRHQNNEERPFHVRIFHSHAQALFIFSRVANVVLCLPGFKSASACHFCVILHSTNMLNLRACAYSGSRSKPPIAGAMSKLHTASMLPRAVIVIRSGNTRPATLQFEKKASLTPIGCASLRTNVPRTVYLNFGHPT